MLNNKKNFFLINAYIMSKYKVKRSFCFTNILGEIYIEFTSLNLANFIIILNSFV